MAEEVSPETGTKNSMYIYLCVKKNWNKTNKKKQQNQLTNLHTMRGHCHPARARPPSAGISPWILSSGLREPRLGLLLEVSLFPLLFFCGFLKTLAVLAVARFRPSCAVYGCSFCFGIRSHLANSPFFCRNCNFSIFGWPSFFSRILPPEPLLLLLWQLCAKPNFNYFVCCHFHYVSPS